MNYNYIVWTGKHYEVEAWVDADGKRVIFFRLNKTIPSQRHCTNRIWITEGFSHPKWWKRQQSIEVAMDHAIAYVANQEIQNNDNTEQRVKIIQELKSIIKKRNQ